MNTSKQIAKTKQHHQKSIASGRVKAHATPRKPIVSKNDALIEKFENREFENEDHIEDDTMIESHKH